MYRAAWLSRQDKLFQMSNWTGMRTVRRHGGMAQSVEHIVHIMGRGAEAPPGADEARRKRGELRSETAVPRRAHDYSEPDRTSEAQ